MAEIQLRLTSILGSRVNEAGEVESLVDEAVRGRVRVFLPVGEASEFLSLLTRILPGLPTQGGTPNPDSDSGTAYRWERRYFAPADTYLYYVLRAGRGGKEKVVSKWRDRESAESVCGTLNEHTPWEVL